MNREGLGEQTHEGLNEETDKKIKNLKESASRVSKDMLDMLN